MISAGQDMKVSRGNVIPPEKGAPKKPSPKKTAETELSAIDAFILDFKKDYEALAKIQQECSASSAGLLMSKCTHIEEKLNVAKARLESAESYKKTNEMSIEDVCSLEPFPGSICSLRTIDPSRRPDKADIRWKKVSGIVPDFHSILIRTDFPKLLQDEEADD